MKKFTFLFVMLLMGVAAQAQSDDYLPLVREGVRWHYIKQDYYVNEVPYQETPIYYEFKGDSIFNGKTYKKCYVTSNDPEYNGVVALVREEDKKVYRYFVEKEWANPQTGKYFEEEIYSFDPSELFVQHFSVIPTFVPAGEITIQGKQCKCYGLGEKLPTCTLIEGVGVEHRNSTDVFGNLIEPLLEYMTTDGLPETVFAFDRLEDLDGNILYNSKEFTAINDLKAEGLKGDNRYYNLMGQPVNNPSAGIYIHNGKKVVVK